MKCSSRVMEGTIATKGGLPTMTGVESGVRIGLEAYQGRSNPLPGHLGGRTAGTEETGQAVRGCGSEWPARPGPTSPGGPAKWGQFRQGQQSSARPGSPGSAVQGANVGNDRGVGFVPNGNAGVNDGSENPGALHPTRPAVPDSATVWGLRAGTGSGRVRFVHHLGLRFLEHVRTGQSATAVAQPASRSRLQAGRVRPRPGRRKAAA